VEDFSRYPHGSPWIGFRTERDLLYQAFSEIFPARELFWRALATEEQRHAKRLGELGSDPAINRWLLGESGLRLQALRSSIGYVESQIDRTRRGGLTLLQALSVARDLESALIEKQFSRMAESQHIVATPILMELATETERHRKLLADAVEVERQAAW
jgi:hypothetical protein